MIGELYEALAAVLAVWADKSTARYKPAADGFSFDAEPRADLTAYYVEPAQTRQAVGYVGGGGLDVAMVTIWASLEARDDPAAAGPGARERPATAPGGDPGCGPGRRQPTPDVRDVGRPAGR